MTRIAVIGGGITGLACAWTLARERDVTLYEAAPTLGGHANTVDVTLDGMTHPVDTGFLVFNRRTYPGLVALFEHLGIAPAPSDMTFSVSLMDRDFEWGGANGATLFAQRRNMMRPSFLGMLVDIVRFNREAMAIATGRDVVADATESLDEFLQRRRFGVTFRERYLLPMAGAIWSCPPSAMGAFPLVTFVRFFHNHGLLQIADRPQWFTVPGGSRRYVERMWSSLPRVSLGRPVRRVAPDRRGGWSVAIDGVVANYEQVVFACHADQALAMLDSPTEREASVLGAFRFQSNVAILHADRALLPRRERIWSAWNYIASDDAQSAPVGCSYLLNRLQPLPFTSPLVLTMNPPRAPRDDRVLARFTYAHPIFDRRAIVAQRELAGIQGRRGLWFGGAWTRYGFHEDGLASGLAMASALGVEPPWRQSGARSERETPAASPIASTPATLGVVS